MSGKLDKFIQQTEKILPDLPQAVLAGLIENQTQRHQKDFQGQTYQIVNIPNKIGNGELRWSCTATHLSELDVVGLSDGEHVSPNRAEEAALRKAEEARLAKHQATAELIILLISADPHGGTVNIQNMENRVRTQVQQHLGQAGMQRFRFELRLSVSPDELIDLIRSVKPHVLHFFGHSGQNGIALRDSNNRDQYHLTDADALIPTLSLKASKNIKLLLLTGCSNDKVAQDLAQKSKVDYVIGTTADITNEQAIFFSAQFYTLLVQGETIWESYNTGQAQLAGLNLQRAFHIQSKRTEQQDEQSNNVAAILWPAPRQ